MGFNHHDLNSMGFDHQTYQTSSQKSMVLIYLLINFNIIKQTARLDLQGAASMASTASPPDDSKPTGSSASPGSAMPRHRGRHHGRRGHPGRGRRRWVQRRRGIGLRSRGACWSSPVMAKWGKHGWGWYDDRWLGGDSSNVWKNIDVDWFMTYIYIYYVYNIL